MKSNIHINITLLICLSLLTSSCGLIQGKGPAGGVPGSGQIENQIRETGAFSALVIEYPVVEVIVQPGEKDSVTIEADDNLLSQISSEVVSGRIIIKSTQTDWETSVNPSVPVKITVTASSVDEIVFSSIMGSMQVNSLKTDTFRLEHSGGGDVHLVDLEVDLLDVVFSGAGKIIAGGSARELKLLHGGLGSFDAVGLPCTKAIVELSGMGDAIVNVEQELIATLTGAGSIKYYGNPRIQQEVTGAGSIKPAE
jgi:hypothetical protein